MSSSASPTQDATTPSKEAKSLNVNAKSFVPKMDAGQLETNSSSSSTQPSSTPVSSTTPANAQGGSGNRTPPRAAPGTPPQLPGFPPGMTIPLGMPPPGMHGMPPGMMSPILHPGMFPRQMSGPGFMPPSPTQVNPRLPMAPGFVTTPVMTPLGPGTPLATQTPQISVGNATLMAKRSQHPPKFSCVLLAGVTGVGKSTAGRQLTQELNEDKLGWHFFSGADYLKDAPSAKPATWDVTKSVFDGLNETLDSLLARQQTNPIRGLLIDKQLRGVEDLYYLTSLLRSKGLLLWGVVGMDASDEVLVNRLGNTPGLNEKIKFHRVIYSRIAEAAKMIGVWRTVDANAPKADSVKMLRTMVLGCSSQSPTKQLQTALYHDSPIPLVDNYSTYNAVMTSLFTCIPRNNKGAAIFPGFTAYVPLSAAQLDAKKQPLKEYVARRKVDGVKYVLFFDGTKLFLIPRHMRCIFEVPSEAWLGVHLSNTGKFVVDGELVKTTKDRSKEKFVVYDVLYWAERGSGTNLVTRSTWKERQERLKTNLCSESTAFFPKKGDCVVVHETIVEDIKQIPTLLSEPCDYPTDGLIFHSTSTRREEPTYMWRPPESLTADFRLGTFTLREDNVRVFIAEVFDQKQARYTQYRSDTIDIGGTRPTAVEGAIVTCTLELSPTGHSWTFMRVRHDLQIAMMKTAVDEIIKDAVVPKQALLDYVNAIDKKENPHAATTQPSKQPTLGGQAQPAAPTAPVATAPGKATRQVFGSALAGPGGAPPEGAQTTPAPTQPTLRDIVAGEHKQPRDDRKNNDMQTDAEKLSSIVGNVRVRSMNDKPQNDVQALESIVGSVSVVGSKDKRRSPNPQDREGSNDRRRRDDRDDRDRPSCNECRRTKSGRVDKRNGKFYCYDCWAKEGVEECDECHDFASGRRESVSRRRRGDFFCNACWSRYESKQAKQETRGEESRGRGRSSGKADDSGAERTEKKSRETSPTQVTPPAEEPKAVAASA